ncbi:uncharacterized protein LOC127791698 [Diospyros lotus]|uniref:uncharacterized protein LOC127791698 n=1 Tax=Diospyros lotus TaxID=55363 RepID=UPI00225285F3|nr:uncharacterized protein LOC127791698 [Diospyros lotus]
MCAAVATSKGNWAAVAALTDGGGDGVVRTADGARRRRWQRRIERKEAPPLEDLVAATPSFSLPPPLLLTVAAAVASCRCRRCSSLPISSNLKSPHRVIGGFSSNLRIPGLHKNLRSDLTVEPTLLSSPQFQSQKSHRPLILILQRAMEKASGGKGGAGADGIVLGRLHPWVAALQALHRRLGGRRPLLLLLRITSIISYKSLS